MKKCFILLLLAIFISNNISFVSANPDTFVLDAVAVVENRINIPENYDEFTSKVTVSPDGKIALMSWSGDDKDSLLGGQINVTVDDNMRIVSYNRYIYGEFTGNHKLSLINCSEAEDIASVFVKNACPDIYPSLRLESAKSTAYNRNYQPYNVIFYRYENNIPCFDNYVIVTVNPYNAEVSSMEVAWTDYDRIHSPNAGISLEKAKVQQFDLIGMVAEYVTDNTGKLYTRYFANHDGINYINAYTGKVLNTGYGTDSLDFKNAYTSDKKFEVDINPHVEFNNFDIIFNNKYIQIDNSFKLVSITGLSDSFSNYSMLEFVDENGYKKSYVVDVVNGDIRHFSQQTPVVDDNKKLTEKNCRYIADSFVNEYAKSYIGECGYLNSCLIKNYKSENVWYFNYTRYINGMCYDNNGIVVGVSSATGNVVSIWSGWEVMETPSFELAVSPEKAFETYIESVDYCLQYITYITNDLNTQLRPVYAVKPGTNVYIDSITGLPINESGEVLSKNSTYNDVLDYVYEDEVLTLQSCGILDNAEYFKPEEYITICDYLLWICRTIDCVEYSDISQVAQILTSKGIVTYEQLSENGNITMEEGIEYIISYMGYGDIASLTDTYITGFVDEGLISPELIGHAAIAKGLKIFYGNAFLPKEYMTRGVAAEIIYNYITH